MPPRPISKRSSIRRGVAVSRAVRPGRASAAVLVRRAAAGAPAAACWPFVRQPGKSAWSAALYLASTAPAHRHRESMAGLPAERWMVRAARAAPVSRVVRECRDAGAWCPNLISFAGMNARLNGGVARAPSLPRRAACPGAYPCYRPRTLKRPRGRGGIGRRARFRSWYRKMWGFESLRPHHPSPLTERPNFHFEWE